MREGLRTARVFFAFAWYVLGATLLAAVTSLTTSSSAHALTHSQTIRYHETNAPSLRGAKDVLVSPDGRFVYLLSNGYDAVSNASRNPVTGQLNPGGWASSGGVPEGWYAVAMSADGRFIYLGTVATNTVRVYSRDANGNMMPVQSYTGGGLGLQSAGFLSLTVSPDGRFLYGTTGQVSGLVVFARDVVNGTLTLVQEHVDGVDGNLLGQQYGDGEGPMNNIAFSSDGAFMYAAASEDDALNVYARDADTGAVMLLSTLVNNSDGIVGLGGATSVVVSPDDRFVYVAGKEDHSVVTFARDALTGGLSFVQLKTFDAQSDPGLEGARSLLITQDGRFLYVGADDSAAVSAYSRNIATGELTLIKSVSSADVAGLGKPAGMALDPLGLHLYVADHGATPDDGAIVVFALPLPVVALLTTEQTVDEGGVVTLDGGLQVFDGDSATLNSARVTISSGYVPGDRLIALAPAPLNVDFDVATGVLTLSGAHSLAEYQAALRSMQFEAGNDDSLETGQTRIKKVDIELYDGIYHGNKATIEVTVNGRSGPPAFMLSYSAGANGSIDGLTSQTVAPGGSGSVVTAVPSEGYYFVNWSDGSTANPRADTNVNGGLSVTANFAIKVYEVTAIAYGKGFIDPPSVMVEHGQYTYFKVAPELGAEMLSIEGCGGSFSKGSFGTGAITGACTVIANFTPELVTLTASAGTGGAITPTSVTVNRGTSTSFTVTPQSGYSIQSVEGCNGTLSGETYTVASVFNACTITASFAAGGVSKPRFDPAHPEAIDINARELMTALPSNAAPRAVDAQGNALPVTLVGGKTRFAAGKHVLQWRAVDSQGVEATVNQVLRIWPTVGFSPDVSIGGQQGNFDFFRIALNGRAPEYPFVVNYTVDGDKGTDLKDGQVVFEDGEIEKSVGFAVVSTMSSGEADRLVRLTLDEGLNRVSARSLTITLSALNLAPAVKLSAWQGNDQAPSVAREAGPVVIVADIRDPNTNDTHTLQWTTPNNLAFTETEGGIEIQPGNLSAGVHRFELTVTDSGNAPQVARAIFDLVVVDARRALPAGAHGWLSNGLPDHPDYAPAQPNVLPERRGELSHFLMESDPGTQLALGAYSVLHGQYQTEVPGSLLNGSSLPADNVANHGGYFDFVVSNLPRVGESVSVVIPQRAAIPARAVYRKYDPATNAWRDFHEDNDNRLASAPGESGFCPPPSDGAYRAGLNAGDWCVRLTIRDGGPNDADRQVNGSVVDPGGVGVLPDVVVNGNVKGKSGGGSFDLWLLFGLAVLAFARHFKRPAGWLALAALGATSTSAVADESAGYWYGGAQFGQAESDVSSGELTRRLQQSGYDVTARLSDTSRTAWRVHGGYQFSKYLGVEAGYVDLGDVKSTFSGDISDLAGLLSTANKLHPASAEGFDLSVVGRYAFGERFSVHARVGGLRWDTRTSTQSESGQIIRRNDDGIDAVIGLGAAMNFGKNWVLGVDATRYEVSGDDIDFIAAGLSYRWR